MYPKNAASPPRIAIGPVIQISDGAVQSSGVSVVVRAEGGSETAGGGTTTYGASSNVVYYAPTQAETNYTAFVVTAYKTGCIPVSQTIITSASSTSGKVDVSHVGGTAQTAGDILGTWTSTKAGYLTGDAYVRLGAPAGASVSADVAAVKSDTGAIKTKTDYLPSATAGAAGGVFIAGSNAATSVTTAFTANITGNLSGSVGSVTGAVGSVTGAVGSVTGNVGGNVTGTIGGLTAAAIADFFDTNSGTTYSAAVAGSVVKEIADNAGGSALTEAGIADAVWDELLSGHAISGSAGEALSAAGTAGDPWTTAIPGAYGAGTAGYIIGNNLNAPVGTVDTVVDAIKAVTDNLPNSGALTDLATAANLATVDGIVDAILIDTAEIGVAGAGLTALASATNLATVDTVVDAIKLVTDNLPNSGALTTISTGVAAIEVDTQDIQSRLPAALTAGGNIKADALAVNGETEAASRLGNSTQGIVTGTCDTGCTTTSIATSALSPAAVADDQFTGRIVTFLQDTTTTALRGQSTDITTNTALGVLTVTALTTAPASGDIFVIT